MSLVDETVSGELLDVLCKRNGLLKLVSDGVTDKRELEAELDCSRSTLNRGLRELEARGLVERGPPVLELTTAGEVVSQTFTDVWEPLVRAVPLLENLEQYAPVDPALFDRATVHQASAPNPDAPLDALSELLQGTSRVRAVVPACSCRYAGCFAESVPDLEALDVLLSEECLDAVESKSDHPLLPVTNASVTTAVTTSERLPFTLALAEDSAVWLGVQEQGLISGAIQNDDPAAVEWAADVFDTYWPATE